MVDLTIIGGGYWGSAIGLEAKRLGWSVLILDDADPKSGSRAASGICDPKAYKSDIFLKYWPKTWTKSDLDDSFDWLLANGGYRVREGFWNKFQDRVPREGAECIYLPNVKTITSVPVCRRIRRVSTELDFSKLVIAAGYRTDEVLKILGLPTVGVGQLYGRGILAKGTPSKSLPLSVMIKPYVKHTIREWTGGVYKIGDTAEEKPNPQKLESLRTVGRAVLEGYSELTISEGYRPVTSQFLVEKICPNVVVATGGHRLGLGLCGLVAKKALEMLK